MDTPIILYRLCIHIHTSTYRYRYIVRYMHICKYIHTYINTQTHTHTHVTPFMEKDTMNLRETKRIPSRAGGGKGKEEVT